MSKNPAPDAEVKVGYLESLSEEDRAKAEALTAHIQEQLKSQQTDPATRPTFDAPADAATVKAEASTLVKRYNRKTSQGGFLPRPNKEKSADIDEKELAEIYAPYINLFPKGELEDNFSIARWAAAVERSQNTLEGSSAFRNWAPWEAQYYEALTKAQGDMVSGADGGFLAPEVWGTAFIDQIYAAQALSKVPVTRLPMSARVHHLPRLSGAVTVN